jgi:hypothetical protein
MKFYVHSTHSFSVAVALELKNEQPFKEEPFCFLRLIKEEPPSQG